MATSPANQLTSASPPQRPRVLASGRVPFVAEARLLQELGERLVASPDVAILELIKNSRDADADNCEVRLRLSGPTRRPQIIVADTGEGMHQQDFLERWMRIATQAKRDPLTPKY